MKLFYMQILFACKKVYIQIKFSLFACKICFLNLFSTLIFTTTTSLFKSQNKVTICIYAEITNTIRAGTKKL